MDELEQYQSKVSIQMSNSNGPAWLYGLTLFSVVYDITRVNLKFKQVLRPILYVTYKKITVGSLP